MINIPIPKHLEPQLEFLRELYSHGQLIGELIYRCEQRLGFCEFALAICDQREELAKYQFWGMIQHLYQVEYERVQMTRLGEYIPDYLSRMSTRPDPI